MTRRFIVLATCLLVATVALAAPSNVVLDRSGTLYRAVRTTDGISVVITGADESNRLEMVPGTANTVISDLSLAVDPLTGAVVVTWTNASVPGGDRVEIAVLVADLWFGPFALGTSGDGISTHPATLLQTIEEPSEDGEASSLSVVLVTWWWAPSEDSMAEGNAVLAVLPLGQDGEPMIDELSVEPLRTETPWGVACEASSHADSLTYPYPFIDPATGEVNVMYVDFTDCLFSIQQVGIEAEVTGGGEDSGDDDVTSQRRRHVVVFGRTTMIAIPTRVSFERATFEVGRNLSIVAYWDAENSIEYVRMDESGWSETKSLPLGGDLDHEQAVQLIRKLAWR